MKDCFFRRNALSLPEIFSNQFRMKYPIGIQNFEKIREDGYVYVDKTALVYDILPCLQYSKGIVAIVSMEWNMDY